MAPSNLKARKMVVDGKVCGDWPFLLAAFSCDLPEPVISRAEERRALGSPLALCMLGYGNESALLHAPLEASAAACDASVGAHAHVTVAGAAALAAINTLEGKPEGLEGRSHTMYNCTVCGCLVSELLTLQDTSSFCMQVASATSFSKQSRLKGCTSSPFALLSMNRPLASCLIAQSVQCQTSSANLDECR